MMMLLKFGFNIPVQWYVLRVKVELPAVFVKQVKKKKR